MLLGMFRYVEYLKLRLQSFGEISFMAKQWKKDIIKENKSKKII